MKRRKNETSKRKTAKKRVLGKYKSGLERTCADLLTESGLSFTYEEHEYLLLDSFKYDGVYYKTTPKSKDLVDRTGKIVLPIKYTPDFVSKDGSWIIETKGYTPTHHDFPMRWKLFLKYLEIKGNDLPSLFICRNRQQIEEAIQIIKDGKGNIKEPTRRKLRNSNREGS